MDNEEKKLAEELEKARKAYYNLDPIMSDSEYDKKRNRLKELCPEHEEIKAVGAPPPKNSVWDKIKHKIPMGSLSKVNTVEEFETWTEKTGSNEFIITHKIDGASLELVYEKGKLVYGATRGDGTVGENITSNIIKIPDIPHQIGIQEDVTIRGEVIILNSVFEKNYAEKYANPRNTTSAKMREKKNNGEDCKSLNFLAYWAEYDNKPKRMCQVMDTLEELGFKVPSRDSGKIDLMKQVFEMTSKTRPEIPYEIDGMVISVNDIEILSSLGEISMRPRGQIAWKFESEKTESRVTDVMWQVGSTGRITPVAKIEPTKIGGVTVESVSLHNLKMFRELKLFQGCRVIVERRNDVIPYISKNIDS